MTTWLALSLSLSLSAGAPSPEVPQAKARAGVAERTIKHHGARYRVVSLDLAQQQLELVGQVRAGEVRTFVELEAWLKQQGRALVMATNAGIYAPGERPLGLHIEAGKEVVPLNTDDGEGNFFLKPGGVFWIDTTGAHVAPTDAVKARPLDVATTQLATQSGPLLLAAGKVHPAFRPTSTNKRVRSAVGVDPQGRVWIAISRTPVRFHDVATLFRDKLGCPDALYLDGAISKLWTATHRPPSKFRYAGFLVVSRPSPAQASPPE